MLVLEEQNFVFFCLEYIPLLPFKNELKTISKLFILTEQKLTFF